jgi:hypothetical protein
MPAKNAQVVDPQEFIPILDYEFSGYNGTADKKRAFIIALHAEGTLFHAAHAIGISRTTVYRWLESDPEFVRAVEESKEDCADIIETSVFKRARTDSLLAMFYLKAKRPAFRDKVAVDMPTIQNQVKDFIRELFQAANINPQPHQKEPLLLSPAINAGSNGDGSSCSSAIDSDQAPAHGPTTD